MNKDYTIGIIGGMGSFATVDFFSASCRGVPSRKRMGVTTNYYR